MEAINPSCGGSALKPLRILHVTHQYRPAVGGSEQHVINTSEALARRGHHVQVYTTRSVDYRTWRNELPRHELLDGVDVRRFNSVCRRACTWRLLDYGYINYRKERRIRYQPFIMFGSGPVSPGLFANVLLRGCGYDVIHVNTLPYAHLWYTALAAKAVGAPLVITPFLHTQQADIFDVEWFNAAMRSADRVVAMTQVERDYLLQRFVDPARIVMGGVGLEPEALKLAALGGRRAQFGIPEGTFVVLFLGRRAAYKGLDALLEAYLRLRAQRPDAILVLAGPTEPYWDELRARYPDLPGLVDLGTVSDEAKAQLLSVCDALVLPSTGESFGIVFCEAWTFGKPVVGARAGALADMIDDGEDGFLVAPGDADDLAAKLQALRDDPALRQRLGQRGYHKVMSRYTVERVTDELEALYAELARSKRGSR